MQKSPSQSHRMSEWINKSKAGLCVCVLTAIRKFQKSHGTVMLQWSNDFFPPPLHSSFLNPTEINLLRWKFSILLRLQNGNLLTGLSAVVMEKLFWSRQTSFSLPLRVRSDRIECKYFVWEHNRGILRKHLPLDSWITTLLCSGL